MDVFKLFNIDLYKSIIQDITAHDYQLFSTSQGLISLVKHIFFDKYSFKIEKQGEDSALLFSVSPLRKNDELAFDKIKSCAGQSDQILMQVRVRPANFVYNIYLAAKYFFSKSPKSVAERIMLAGVAVSSRKFVKFLQGQHIENYSYGIVYNDLNKLDNVFVQYLKSKGITTVTCQHGAYVAPEPEYGYLGAGIELQHSIADIFLAWNQMTCDEAEKAGLDIRKFHILGIPKCIGEPMPITSGVKNCFGVVLATHPSDKDNLRLIKISNSVAAKLKMHYLLRFHPNLTLDEYDSYIDHKWCIKEPKSMTVAEHASSVDFSIITSSTVYLELLYYHSKVYKLKTDNIDKYKKFKEYDFTTDDELIDALNKDYNMSAAFNYYCFTSDPERTYKEFFARLRPAEIQKH